MDLFKASAYPYTILRGKDYSNKVYPYLRSLNGDKEMLCIGPNHGRSYVVGQHNDGRYIVSKGNGLSYSQYTFLNTKELGDDTFGLLLVQDAIRDYTVGMQIEDLGIKTNRMEYIIQLDKEIILSNNHTLKPVLLQYSVECPYRICDAAFPDCASVIKKEVSKWDVHNLKGSDRKHLIAANVLIKNLRVLHDNEILHNAITAQNYTWALELLDFEIAHSPGYPYSNEDDKRHVRDYFNREIMYTYEIINYIAHCLGEQINYGAVDDLFKSYGFDLSTFNIPFSE